MDKTTANLKCYSGNETDLNYVVNTINKIRKDNGLKPLKQDNRLNMSSFLKAKDMYERKYWSHSDPEGKMAWDLIKKNGFNYKKAGENLAKVFNNVSSVEEWSKSPSHLKNILNSDFESVGYSKVGDIKVMHFGKEKKL